MTATHSKGKTNGNSIPAEQYTRLDRVIKQYGHAQDALLEVLHAAQEAEGYLSREVLSYIADRLDLAPSHVYGVATFFHMFSLDPEDQRHCHICTDPACQIAGAPEVLAAAQRQVESHGNGNIRVKPTSCLGLCDQAPAAMLDHHTYVELRPDRVTDLFSGKARTPRLNVTGEPRILTGRIGKFDPTDLDGHRSAGAFSALEKALQDMKPTEVIEEVKASGLAGRGGAGFPTGLKWEFTRKAAGEPRYVVCNFDESEPGTFKDRVLMQGDPYRTMEGILLCGYAIGAEQGYIFIRGEYPEVAQTLKEAIDRLYAAGLLGEHIMGSDFKFDLEVRRSAGAYICGEETALFEAIEGKRGVPRSKPPYPTVSGLFGKPTVINNVETLAIIPELILNGGAWMRQWGTEKSIGLRLFCLSGHVNRPGVVEAPYGLTVRQLVETYGGGFLGEPQAILMGGAAGGLLHPDRLDTPLTNEDLNPLGTPIGSGVVMVFNQEVNLLEILVTLARFFINETCGQCVTCRVGTNQVHTLLAKLSGGTAQKTDLEKLEKLLHVMRSVGECGLGTTAPNPIQTSLKYFREKLEAAL